MSNASTQSSNCQDKVGNTPLHGSTVVPPLDIQDFPAEVQVHVELPGVLPEEVKLETHQGTLSLVAHPSRNIGSESRYLLRERHPVTYKRQIRLGDTIDGNGIWAEGSKGILTIHLPKKTEVQKRIIPVKSGS